MHTSGYAQEVPRGHRVQMFVPMDAGAVAQVSIVLEVSRGVVVTTSPRVPGYLCVTHRQTGAAFIQDVPRTRAARMLAYIVAGMAPWHEVSGLRAAKEMWSSLPDELQAWLAIAGKTWWCEL